MYAGKIAAAVTMVLPLALAATADAGTMSKAVLDYNKWKDNAKTQVADIACNYLYTDYANRLLYYGTSSHCRKRLSEHANAMKHVLELLEEVRRLAPFVVLGKPLWEWSSTVHMDLNGNELGPYESRGTSDMCLATNEFMAGGTNDKPKIGIWYYTLPSTVAAVNVEDCVLKTTVGYCNRKGQGTDQGSEQAFINTVNQCVIKEGAEKKHKGGRLRRQR